MRLINCSTGSLEEFTGRNIPRYGILSHTWAEEEVTLKDFSLPIKKSMKGFQKIKKTCYLARKAGLNYVWIDTCCIDKSSSAELSEAINSMYKWYQRAEVCIVYLFDLDSGGLNQSLSECRWFTRGWTLQELIAPMNILFCDKHWNVVGSKAQLNERLSSITSIGIDVLRHRQSLNTIPVAEKMAWAAHRKTTRIEDTAYCLMGLFDLNMPLLYGEEDKAFLRLQQEIIRTTADLSIFAWKLPQIPENKDRTFCSVLAHSPSSFSRSMPLRRKHAFECGELTVSNIGIKTSAQLFLRKVGDSHIYRYILPLDCAHDDGKHFAIQLRKCGPDHFVRENPSKILPDLGLCCFAPRGDHYLLTRLPESWWTHTTFPIAQTRTYALQIQKSTEVHVIQSWPESTFDQEDALFFAGDAFQKDVVCLQLGINVEKKIGDQLVKGGLDCMFYALGWSDPDENRFQCSIIDYETRRSVANDFRSFLISRNPARDTALFQLRRDNIPRRMSVITRTTHTNYLMSTSLKPSRVTDPQICQKACWRVEFHTSILDRKTAPKPQRDRRWKLE